MILLWALGHLFRQAYAEAPINYGQTTQRLHAEQAKLDQAIQAHGWSLPGMQQSTGLGSDDSDAKKAHLFQVHGDLSMMRLHSGQMIFGHSINRLVVGSSEDSPVLIDVDPNQGRFSGLRVMGKAKQSSTVGRLSIEFQKIIFHTGKTESVTAMALDETGAYGISAEVVSQKALSVLGAMASSLISGIAASQQSQATNAFGFQQTQTTGRNAILQGVAQTAADQSKRLIDDATSEKPVLIVEPGTPVTIFVQGEVRY